MRANFLIICLFILYAPASIAGKDFYRKDMQQETLNVVRLVAQTLASKHGAFTIVIFGGERAQQMEVYEALQKLDDEDYELAFLVASDNDSDTETLRVEFFNRGRSEKFIDGSSYSLSFKLKEKTGHIREQTYLRAKKVHNISHKIMLIDGEEYLLEDFQKTLKKNKERYLEAFDK